MSDERLETTMDLLAMTLPGVGSPEKGYVDSEEDEIFFGQKSSKEEEKLKSKKLNLLRRTLQGVRRSPQSSPKSAFNPIEEEGDNDDIDEKENACVAPAPSPAKEAASEDAGKHQKTPLKDLQLHQKVVAGSSPKPTPSPRKINTANPDCKVEDESDEILLPPTPKTRQNLTPVKTPANRVDQLKGQAAGKREVKSASKLLANLPATAVAAVTAAACDNDDDDDDEENSILDVNNDQLFDDSIFTEYDASNLSSIVATAGAAAATGQQPRKSWKQVARQERRKTGNFVEAPSITSLVEGRTSSTSAAAAADTTTTCVPETPASLSLDEVDRETSSRAAAENRRDSSASTFSDYFNTSREERILFEKYGEDYDEIVGQMSRTEKMRLKQEVGSMEAKAPEELLSTMQQHHQSNVSASTSTHSFIKAVPVVTEEEEEEPIVEEEEHSPAAQPQLESPPFRPEESIFMAPTAAAAAASATTTTTTTNRSLGEEVQAATAAAAPTRSNPELKTPSRGGAYGFLATKSSNPEFRTPTFSRLHHQQQPSASGGKTMPNYLRPTQSSRLKASPSKTTESPLPGGGGGGGGGGGKLFAHPLGQNVGGTLRSNAAAAASAEASPAYGRLFANPSSLTPQSSSSKLPVRRVAASGIDMKSIVSPVSQYIKSVPVQPLVSKIRPKASKFLGEELQGLSDDNDSFNEPAAASSRQTQRFAAMPERHYVSSRVALEQKVAPEVKHKELPKAFGMGNTTEATVVKHLGRMRVPKTLDMESPSKDGASLKKALPRESMASNNTMDESSMELSIREVKEIKKLTALPRK